MSFRDLLEIVKITLLRWSKGKRKLAWDEDPPVGDLLCCQGDYHLRIFQATHRWTLWLVRDESTCPTSDFLTVMHHPSKRRAMVMAERIVFSGGQPPTKGVTHV